MVATQRLAHASWRADERAGQLRSRRRYRDDGVIVGTAFFAVRHCIGKGTFKHADIEEAVVFRPAYCVLDRMCFHGDWSCNNPQPPSPIYRAGVGGWTPSNLVWGPFGGWG